MVLACVLGAAASPRTAPLGPSDFTRPVLAQALALPPDGGEERKHEAVYKVINFVLLVGGLAYLLRKPLADFFLGRSAAIRKSLEEGRKALEASQAQLRAVEEKLARLEAELRAFKASAQEEMQAEHERLRQAAVQDAEKVLETARAQMELAARAGLLELKKYATEEALKLAEELIRQRLDEAGRTRLVRQFISRIETKPGQN